jgi:hypothetical protein
MMGSRKELATEDLAIQDTLAMTVEERLMLLANLIVDKIIEDQKGGELLLKKIMGCQGG